MLAFRCGQKTLPWAERLRLSVRLREATARFGQQLFINGHVDLAILTGADGVHLGVADFSLLPARSNFPYLSWGSPLTTRLK